MALRWLCGAGRQQPQQRHAPNPSQKLASWAPTCAGMWVWTRPSSHCPPPSPSPPSRAGWWGSPGAASRPGGRWAGVAGGGQGSGAATGGQTKPSASVAEPEIPCTAALAPAGVGAQSLDGVERPGGGGRGRGLHGPPFLAADRLTGWSLAGWAPTLVPQAPASNNVTQPCLRCQPSAAAAHQTFRPQHHGGVKPLKRPGQRLPQAAVTLHHTVRHSCTQVSLSALSFSVLHTPRRLCIPAFHWPDACCSSC